MFRVWFASLTCCCFAVLSAAPTMAQLPNGWKAHDLKRPAPPVVEPGESNLPLAAPKDATVLFDGKDLSQWRSRDGGEAKWRVVDGAMESVAGGGYVFTKEEFGDCQLHIEWTSPKEVKGNSQGRGNSGVYMMGMFEVQVLDSYNNPTYADGSAGSIYGQHPPLVNVCRPPGEWQSYDIIFKRPRFKDGKLVSPAHVTVLHNGVLIQNHSEFYGPSEWLVHTDYNPELTQASLGLQDHGNPVRYRNIWIRPLADPARPAKAEPYASETVTHALTDAMADRAVGDYGKFQIKKTESGLETVYAGRRLEMVPLSDTEFGFRKTAGKLMLGVNDEGQVEEAFLHLDAAGPETGKKK